MNYPEICHLDDSDDVPDKHLRAVLVALFEHHKLKLLRTFDKDDNSVYTVDDKYYEVIE